MNSLLQQAIVHLFSQTTDIPIIVNDFDGIIDWDLGLKHIFRQAMEAMVIGGEKFEDALEFF